MKFMQIKPQKARGKLLESMWTDPEWVAEEKYDGDRRIAQFFGEGRVRFTGTRESVDGSGYVEKSDNLPLLSDPLSKLLRDHESDKLYRAVQALDGTALDGEIVAPWAKGLPGGKSKYVTSIMGSDPERAIMLQKKHGWLEYMVFDCLWYKGKDVRGLPLALRRPWAVEALNEWDNKHAKIVQQSFPSKNLLKRILDDGGEGLILKNKLHTYGDEKLWVKVKGEWTADVVIMGYEMAKAFSVKKGESELTPTKYKNMVGAIVIGQFKDGKLTRLSRPGHGVSGFDDATRLAFTTNGKKYKGMVAEILHNGSEPTGAFRHPRFKRFRPDKSPKDCVYREDET